MGEGCQWTVKEMTCHQTEHIDCDEPDNADIGNASAVSIQDCVMQCLEHTDKSGFKDCNYVSFLKDTKYCYFKKQCQPRTLMRTDPHFNVVSVKADCPLQCNVATPVPYSC